MVNRFRGDRLWRSAILVGISLALLLPCAAAAQPDRPPTIELVDSGPGQEAVLTRGQPLYLRFRYQSDIPIHILVSGAYRGDVVQGFLHDSEELFPAGNREAVVWLAYRFGAKIDYVQVRIWNANKAQVAKAAFPIRAEWTARAETGAGDEREAESWVSNLTAAQRERMAATLSDAREAGGWDPFDLIFLCVPGYFLLQVALARGTSGWRRKATLAPAVIMVPILAYTVLAFAAQSNLWPLLMLLTAPLALLYLVCLSLVRLLWRLARAF
jgi:hypothetical protein